MGEGAMEIIGQATWDFGYQIPPLLSNWRECDIFERYHSLGHLGGKE